MIVKIYKQYLPLAPNTAIYTDLQGELLTIEEQRGEVVVYFNANSETYHKYYIYLVETGKEAYVKDGKYLKTLMLANGDYVLHVFIKEILE